MIERIPSYLKYLDDDKYFKPFKDIYSLLR